jgi:hypothetical protein
MYEPTRSPFDVRMLKAYALPAILITAGLQLLRVMFPSLAWYMMDVVGVPSLQLAPYALGAFAPAFLSPLLWRLLGQKYSLRLAALGILLARLLEQLAVDPELDLWLSLVGTGFFALFLPLWPAHLRPQPPAPSAPRPAARGGRGGGLPAKPGGSGADYEVGTSPESTDARDGVAKK